MSWHSKPLWSEGMFLQPHHLQQHDRYLERLLEGRTQPLAGHAWGHVTLVIDEAALALGKISLSEARGILPDGTPFDFPTNDTAPVPLDFPAQARDELVVLAIPIRRIASLEADLGGEDASGLTRYRVSEIEIGDNTLAASPTAPVQVGDLRLNLMLQRDVTGAYATLGVARVTERRADNQLVLDKTYIPPTLACRQNAVLAGYLRELIGMLHQRGEMLATHLSQPGAGGVAEIADFLQLQVLNRHEPVYHHLAELPLLHPSSFYAHCLMLAGELCTFFSDSRRPGEYPRYQHDDLQSCFGPLMADLRRALMKLFVPDVIPIELEVIGQQGYRRAVLSDLDLLRSAAFILAVKAQVPGETLRVRFPAQAKAGPVNKHFKDLVDSQLPAIALRALPVVPRQIPQLAGFSYFELDRGDELWGQVQQTGLMLHIALESAFPGLQLECWALKASGK